jgi:hypothetical protein
VVVDLIQETLSKERRCYGCRLHRVGAELFRLLGNRLEPPKAIIDEIMEITNWVGGSMGYVNQRTPCNP